MDQVEYIRLSKYCTSDLQTARLKNIFELGSARKAAKHENVSKTSVCLTLALIRKTAARAGDSPIEDATGKAPPGYLIKGKSTLYGADGGKKIQWVKTQIDAVQRQEDLIAALEESAMQLKGLSLPSTPPKQLDKELLAIYPYGDPHVGMYAWHGDSEADFDLVKATELMISATKSLVASAPPAEKGLVVFLGDFYHADNQTNTTTRGGNQLDVDSRWLKVFKVGVSTAVALIELAKQKHKEVHVIVEIGNHDDHSALALAVCLQMFFESDSRVTVDESGQHYHYYVFGQNLIGVHHGHLSKPQALPEIMAADRPTDWGNTTHRVWYTGHIHTQTRYDFAACEVESFRILPPRDAWSQRMGYRSVGRSMDCIVRHTTRGEIARNTVRAAELV